MNKQKGLAKKYKDSEKKTTRKYKEEMKFQN